MSFTIHTRTEARRGCGYREPGGYYVVSDKLAARCGRLPLLLDVCPTCGHGYKPARAWTWINGDLVVGEGQNCQTEICEHCPLGGRKVGRAGLIWIGKQFYTPFSWTQEAIARGVSRRLPRNSIPRGLVIGETWVFVAHREAVRRVDLDGGKETFHPGIFHAFIPKALEYIVQDTDSESKLQKLSDRGITLIKVERAGEALEMDLQPAE